MSSTQRAQQFNLLLRPLERTMLTKLAEHARLDMAQIVRQAIEARYAMIFGQRPTCADSQHCKCPHMHTLYPPAPPPEPPAPPSAA